MANFAHSNLAPTACTQYFYGTEATNYIRTFNWQGTRHLANQKQNICIRREAGNCRICYSADTPGSDFQISGKTNAGKNGLKGEVCCAYEGVGNDGKGPTDSYGYDCIIIPGAEKTGGDSINDSQCGGAGGLATGDGATAMAKKTVCCKFSLKNAIVFVNNFYFFSAKMLPFLVTFVSDDYEGTGANLEAIASAGFKLRYFQTSC